MYDRYAVYYTATGEFADLGAAWLGWDIAAGCAFPHPKLLDIDLPTLTEQPRTYGFHATLKPPFRLAEGMTEVGLRSAMTRTCAALAPVTLGGLRVAALGRFLALIPQEDASTLKTMAAGIVSSLDSFRAPMSEEEYQRRTRRHFTPAQQKNLQEWGYPHVMDQFRFHMTLTDRLPKSDIAEVQRIAEDYFEAHTGTPLLIDNLTLVGQARGGGFAEIERFPLGGQ